ncbi:hypothetical protein F4808DRAFT_443458 [Astrocystis sublimbata]|nr:hypothetical protein F4808DRAFT_443458 [Astrocystis sublimbata]
MRYLVNHDKTYRALEEWAGEEKLVVASHYFWSAGSQMQKSQAGLYRSLLYDFLRACPKLIPRVCPSRWASTEISTTPLYSDEWTDEELLKAIQGMIKLPDSSIKYCTFIDGVDEYDGEHFELCQLLKELSTSSNMKCCISSRPWNVFEYALGGDSIPKLKLHEVTRPDILLFAQNRLAEHPRWNAACIPQAHMDSIIECITARAQGVFLWVFLVARSLQNGLFDGDTISDLQRRLDSLPNDLESFFRQMINHVDRFHRPNMAKLFLTAVNAKQSLDIEIYRYQEYEEQDTQYALYWLKDGAKSQQKLLQEPCRQRINARCGGLLEIQEGRVDFLHRSVRDFLLTQEVNDELHRESGPDFKVNLSILKAFLYAFRCQVPHRDEACKEDHILWRNGLAYANDALGEDAEAALKLLDFAGDFFADAAEKLKREKLRRLETRVGRRLINYSPSVVDVFQSELIRAGVDRYVAVKLKDNPSYFEKGSSSPLLIVVRETPWSQGRMNVARQLLANGADPNGSDWETPWAEFLRITCHATNSHNFKQALQNGLFLEFIKRGAMLETKICLATKHDAGISSEKSKSSRLLITHFLVALFRYKDNYRNSSECLQALESFFSNSDLELIKSEVAEGLPLIQSLLQQRAMQLLEPGRLRFLAQVIQRLIPRWKQSGCDLEGLIPSMQEVFPAATRVVLINLIKSPGVATQTGPLKRSQSDPESDAWPRKKVCRD